jgi:hypothetical protein
VYRRNLALAVAVVTAIGTAASSQTLFATGSGFLVNDAGWVLTNAHVVQDCDVVRIAGLGDAVSIITDTEADLALALFRGEHVGNPLPLRKDPARLTEEVVALGFPLSNILGSEIRATTGTVSSLAGIQADPRYIQISAPLQSGNSGGPVLDVDGNVIGIATAKLDGDEEEDYQNINFAVTAREAVRFITENGLAFVAATEPTAGDGSVDHVERATRSTYLLECRGYELNGTNPVTSTPDIAPEVSSTSPAMVSYTRMDVLGLDYRTIRDVTLTMCQMTCEADRVCRAYTFNTRYSVCFLKSDAIVLVENENAVGGFDADLTDDVVDSGLVVISDSDSPGGDYQRLRDTDFVGCTLACGVDLRCQAFAFVRRTGDCWLKDSVGPLQSMPGVEFGLRR